MEFVMDITVNADDFGLNEDRTDSILACFRDGGVTHASCMVNMPDCERAMSLARRDGLLGRIGLHLNLSEGRPLSEAMRGCRTFCGGDGLFNKAKYRGTVSRFLLTKHDALCVKDEVVAQIAHFRELGGLCSRVDSHHHVHWDWGVARIVVPLLREAGFDAIRRGVNFGSGLSLSKRIYRGVYNVWLGRQMKVRSDWFCGFAGLMDMSAIASRKGTLEIMVHPMTKNGTIVDGDVCEMSRVKNFL